MLSFFISLYFSFFLLLLSRYFRLFPIRSWFTYTTRWDDQFYDITTFMRTALVLRPRYGMMPSPTFSYYFRACILDGGNFIPSFLYLPWLLRLLVRGYWKWSLHSLYLGLSRGICLFLHAHMIQGPQSFEMCHLAFIFYFSGGTTSVWQAQGYHSLFFFSSSLEHGHEFVGRQKLNRTQRLKDGNYQAFTCLFIG